MDRKLAGWIAIGKFWMKQELNQSRSGSGFRGRRIWSLSTQIGLRGNNKESSSALLIALRYLLFLSRRRDKPNLISLIEQPLRELHEAVDIRKVAYQT